MPKVFWNFGPVRNNICARCTGADCAEPTLSEMHRNQSYGPRPSVAEPRLALLLAVRSFVRAARTCSGVLRIALMGSLVTSKAIPKDADVLVTIDNTMDLDELARAGRRLKGSAQTINLGADIFLADANWMLPRTHLPVSRVPSARGMPRPALRTPRPPQR